MHMTAYLYLLGLYNTYDSVFAAWFRVSYIVLGCPSFSEFESLHSNTSYNYDAVRAVGTLDA